MTQEEKAKAYDGALEWMREIYPTMEGFVKEDAEHFFPELKESEDDRVRKDLVCEVQSWDGIPQSKREKYVAYLEKLKEFQFGYPGIYFYDGEKLHFQGNPAMEEKQKEQKHVDLSEMMVHEEPYIAPVPVPIIADEQKYAEIDEEHKIGKWYTGLIPCWIDAPSSLQPAHRYHGKNVIAIHLKDGGYKCCCIDDKTPSTFSVAEDTHLVEGWQDRKPAEKQDYSGLTELERAIHRGFLCADVENVPVEIIKETAQECLAQMRPAETSNIDLDTKVNDWVGYTLNDNAQSYSRKNVQILLDNCARFFYDYAVMCLDKPAEWNDTKELVFKDICKHLKEEGYNGWIALLEALYSGEFKQPIAEWSEKDDEMVQNVYESLYAYQCDIRAGRMDKNAREILDDVDAEKEWVRKLRTKAFQKLEWSEEDETCLEYALWCVTKTRHFVAKDACDLDACRCAERWLESLRLRPHWKPSEEHFQGLRRAITKAEKGSDAWNSLTDLYEHLKKL